MIYLGFGLFALGLTCGVVAYILHRARREFTHGGRRYRRAPRRSWFDLWRDWTGW